MGTLSLALLKCSP